MAELDMKWQQFLSEMTMTTADSCAHEEGKADADADDDDDADSDGESQPDEPGDAADNSDAYKLTEETRPKCTPLYVSTKTKISYLSRPIDIHDVYWKIPVLKDAVPSEGVI